MHVIVLVLPVISSRQLDARFESKRQYWTSSVPCVPSHIPEPASEQLLYEEFESVIMITGTKGLSVFTYSVARRLVQETADDLFVSTFLERSTR
jgi:hypothetical protein